MMSSTTGQWPPSDTKLTTIIVPSTSAILTISASTHIAASASQIFSILRNTSNYPSWNAFTPTLTIHSQPLSTPSSSSSLLNLNTSFTLNVIMDSRHPDRPTPTQCRVTDLSTPSHPSSYISQSILDQPGSGGFEPDLSHVYRICWTTEGGFVARGLRSERVSEVVDLGDGTAEYRTWECEGGVLARVVKWKFETVLGEKFALWCQGLKEESERLAREGEGSEEVREPKMD